jgi:hypothetical protein
LLRGRLVELNSLSLTLDRAVEGCLSFVTGVAFGQALAFHVGRVAGRWHY